MTHRSRTLLSEFIIVAAVVATTSSVAWSRPTGWLTTAAAILFCAIPVLSARAISHLESRRVPVRIGPELVFTLSVRALSLLLYAALFGTLVVHALSLGRFIDPDSMAIVYFVSAPETAVVLLGAALGYALIAGEVQRRMHARLVRANSALDEIAIRLSRFVPPPARTADAERTQQRTAASIHVLRAALEDLRIALGMRIVGSSPPDITVWLLQPVAAPRDRPPTGDLAFPAVGADANGIKLQDCP